MVKMKRKDYYKNKILYALSKIDYAQSQLAGVEHKNKLATLYFILLNYQKVELKTVLQLTKLSRDEVVNALNVLRKLGLTDWDGVYLKDDKEITVRKDTDMTFSQYVKDLQERYYKKYGEPLGEVKLKEPDVEPKQEIKPEAQKDDWIEIKYSEDIIIKVKKERIKDLLR